MFDPTAHLTSFAHHLLTWAAWLRNSRVSACLAVLGGMYVYMCGGPPAQAAVEPVITAVTTDYQVNPPTLTIVGKYLGSVTPTVTLDGATLVVVTYTSTQVTALLPGNLTPGSYQLTLTNHTLQLQASFDAAIGSVGPEGPAGPAGPTGSAGPAGTPGAPGAQGPAGATGAAGAPGAAGPAGPMGLIGPAGPQGSQGLAGPAGATGPQGLTWQGSWSNSATYNLNDAVAFNGSSYISLIAGNINNQPDTAPASWSPVAMAGAGGAAGPAGVPGATGSQGPSGPIGLTGATGSQGPQGVPGPNGATGPQGLAWQGPWNNSATYNLNDAVSFNGTSYISLIANNTNNEPDNIPAAWSILASVGAAGPAGAAGSPGPTGPQGVAGSQGPQGPIGATGATGTAGQAGPAGPTGATGPAGLTNIYHTAPNSNGTPIEITSSNAFYTVATLTLPAGNYWISSKVTVANDSSVADVEAVCQLSGGPLTGTYAQVDLLPDNSTVGIFLATLPLEAAVTFTSSTGVTLQCEAAPTPTIFVYYPQMTAFPVTSITTQ